MPAQEPTDPQSDQHHQFQMTVDIFGDIRPSTELRRHTQRALKSHTAGQDFFTDITLHDSRNAGGMRVEYTVTAASPSSANRAGAVYLSQLCDLLSAVTRTPVWFYLPDEDSRDERARVHRRASSVDRVLAANEWEWIIGNLVFLRREHPRFLAASSWYRKGLIGADSLNDFCCFWRVIERLAYSFADRKHWKEEDKNGRHDWPVKQYVGQLVADLFPNSEAPAPLMDVKAVAKIKRLRDDLSHGNMPITLEVIDAATSYLKSLENAAFQVLQGVRTRKLACPDPG